MHKSDDELLKNLIDGDEEAFMEFVLRYQDKVFNFFYRLCWNRDTSEDLAQDVFLKVYVAVRRLETPVEFSRILFRIAKVIWYSHLRKIYRTPKIHGRIEEFEDILGKPEEAKDMDAAEKSEAMKQMYGALEELSPEQRLIIELAYFMEMPYKEIAEILEVPIGTVKSRLNSAVNRMRGIIEREIN